MSNLDKSWSGTRTTFNSSTKAAIAFTTGSATAGYTLDKITSTFQAKQSHASGFSAALYNVSSGDPGTQIVALSGSDPATAGNHEFTCPSGNTGCTLAASTTYFIVFSGGNSGYYYVSNVTDTSETNDPSTAGWSIANNGKAYVGSWGSLTASLFLKVDATTTTAPPDTPTPTPTITPTPTPYPQDNVTITRLSLDKYHADWDDYVGTFSHYWATWFSGTNDVGGSPERTENTGTTSETSETTLSQSGDYLFRVQVLNSGNTVDTHYRSFNAGTMDTATPTPTITPTPTNTPTPTPIAISVSNLVNTDGGHAVIRNGRKVAIAFTTGNGNDYRMGSITARFRDADSNAAGFSATLNEASGSNPGTQKASLSGSAPTTADDYTYTCSGAGCALSKNTTYLIQFHGTGSGNYKIATTTDTSEIKDPSTNGWSIADQSRRLINNQWYAGLEIPYLKVSATTSTRPPNTPTPTITPTPSNTPTITPTPMTHGISVSNLANSIGQNGNGTVGNGRKVAIAFTTGNGNDYKMTGITVKFNDADSNAASFSATLNEASGSNPGTQKASLSGSEPTTAGEYTYTCSGAGCTLSEDTTYLIQFHATGSGYYKLPLTADKSEINVPPSNVWSIADSARFLYSGTWYTLAQVPRLKVNATTTQAPPPTPTPMPTPFGYGEGLPMMGDDKPITPVEPAQSWWVTPVQIAPWIPQQITGLFMPWVIALTLVILAGIGFWAWRATRRYG